MEKIFKYLSGLSDADKTDVFRRITKLGEEYGEFCAATLEEDGFKIAKSKRTKSQQREHILEEGCDTMIMCLDIFRHKGFTLDEIKDMMVKKLCVWENILRIKNLIPAPNTTNKLNDDDMFGIYPEEKDESKIIQNARKCLMCNTIIVSTHVHDFVRCGCENRVMVDGGLDYLRGGAVDNTKALDLYLNSLTPKDVIYEKLLWPLHNKDGVVWEFICSLDTDYIIKELDRGVIDKYHRQVMLDVLKKRNIKKRNIKKK